MNKNLLFIGVIGAAIVGAYLYFKDQCEAGTGPAGICNLPMFPPSIDPNVLAAASATQLITQGKAQNLTNVQMQALFNQAVAAKANCKSPMTWDVNGGVCTGTIPVGPVGTPTPNGSGTTTPTQTPSTSDPWANAIALMKMNAGSNSTTFDDWSYQFQYSTAPSGAILPTGFGQAGYITPAIMQSIINAGGGNRAALITAETFVGYLRNVLASIGLSGLGEVPMWLIHRNPLGVM